MAPVGTEEMSGKIHWADGLVIAGYFAVILVTSLWSTCRKKPTNAESYFLASRGMTWPFVGAALFASNIGSEHFVGLAGSGAASGVAIAAFELNAIFILLVLGFLYLPVYIASGVSTMPEYIQQRYGGQRISIYLTLLSILLYILTKISVDLYAGATFIQQAFGVDILPSVLVLLAVTGLYTLFGGLTAVMYTEAIQALLMVVGGAILMIASFVEVGGYGGLLEKYPEAIPAVLGNGSCGLPRQDAFHIYRSTSTGDYPWPGTLVGLPIMGLWYWCSDQVIVQRALSARNISHGKGGTIMAGWIKTLPLFMIVFPGMISRVLYTDDVACATPETCERFCGNPVSCSNTAYARLVIGVLPDGLRGAVLAVMVAALMSSLASIFNSVSTLVTLDIWRRFRPKASERQLLVVGRLVVLAVATLSVLWVPFVYTSDQGHLFAYIQNMQSNLVPPIAAVFFLGIFWGRATEKGALAGLLVGLVVGVIRMVMELAYGNPTCGQLDTRPAILKDVHFTYFAIILFAISILSVVVVSLVTEPIQDRFLWRLTWWTRHSTNLRDPIDSDTEPLVNAATPQKGGGMEVDEPVATDTGWYSTWVTYWCGAPSRAEDARGVASRKKRLREGVSVAEDRKWKIAALINAGVLFTAVISLLIYFG